MTSRRDLYAMGEPLGDSATRRKLGGGFVCGNGGDSSSSSSSSSTNVTETTTNNRDSRMVTDGQSTAIQSDGDVVSTTNIVNNTLDGGATAAGRDVAITALNTNAYNTAALVNATTTLGAQQVQALSLNTTLADHIASAGMASVSASAKENASSFKSLLSAGLDMFKLNTAQASEAIDLTRHLADGAKSAYSDATEQANGNKQTLIVGLVVVGIAAAFAFTRGKL